MLGAQWSLPYTLEPLYNVPSHNIYSFFQLQLKKFGAFSFHNYIKKLQWTQTNSYILGFDFLTN